MTDAGNCSGKMPVNDSSNKRIAPLFWVLCVTLCAMPEFPVTAFAEDAERDRPRPVNPPHEPVEEGLRFGLILGLNSMSWASYSYATSVTTPSGSLLQYSGTQVSPGGTLILGAAVSPPGAFRRWTIGLNLNLGGLESWARPVIPSGTATPFSQSNLIFQIERKYGYREGWSPAISPYIEHDLAFLFGRRLRAGYAYWNQTGKYTGLFVANPATGATGAYDVRLKYSSHLVRFSLNNYEFPDEPDTTGSGSRRGKRKTGLLEQIGVLAGSHQTIMIFVGIGPFWRP